jgi:hypothetical protein
MRILKTATIGILLVALNSVRTTSGQILPTSPLWGNQSSNMSQPDMERRMEQRKMFMQERQKRLVADTDKLLALSTALKEQVDESDKNVLSLDMVKKAEEIEKLAHSVKERIKN